ncbi:hypothetical protein E3Q10_00319 [Wallemia mellicola]|uniref:Histone H1 n=1 Tax=Wallemia mellicola TaxID=1708541 RepID=A0A4T0PXY3_9BASI|nr:hypothetical protein E3Q14_00056 [Wallemia mellicola]TIC17319.1 hypothetical protein E3Q15_00602 [Wallemia mellicola]TIC34176.1 hypothetical protein E3Q10_00319 [Wallemia mellicola]TIC57874.1 hypothetical protein E3Q05_01079 [Wallemia mellicola]
MPAKQSNNHPSYEEMLKECIAEENDKTGVSRQTIKKFLASAYKINPESKMTAHFLSQSLKRGIENNVFVCPKGITGKVKLAPKKRAGSDSSESDDDKVKPKTKRVARVNQSVAPKKTVTGTTASGRKIVTTSHVNEVKKPVDSKKRTSSTTRRVAAKKTPATTAIKKATKKPATKKLTEKAANKPTAKKSTGKKPVAVKPLNGKSTTNRRSSTRKRSAPASLVDAPYLPNKSYRSSPVIEYEDMIVLSNDDRNLQSKLRGNISYELLRTEYEGHAQEISSKLARNGGELVVSLLGGDSTTHEFITGLSDLDNPPKTTLVLVPTGTANALYHSIHSSSTLDKDSIEYKLLSFNSFVSKSNNAKRLALSDVIVDDGSSRKTAHVVVSTAVHAALLHRSEELRSVDTSIERFKTAFMEVCTRWTEGRLNLNASRVFSEGAFSDKVEDITLSGPFTYLLASHIDRLEEKFVIAPHTTTEEGLSVVVVRPTRDPLVREHLEKKHYDAATQTSAKALTDVMYAAYDNGTHLNLKHSNVRMDNQFIAFPVPEVNGRRLSEITNNVQQPPSYEESLNTSETMSYYGESDTTPNTPNIHPSTSRLNYRRSFRHPQPTPPPVPARPHQYASTSAINEEFTTSVLKRNVQPLRVNKKDSNRPQPVTPISPMISDNYPSDNASLSPASVVRRPTSHSRTSSVYSMESRVEPFYGRHTDDEHDAMFNQLTIEEQEQQDLSQAIEMSKSEVSQPFSVDDNDQSTVSSHLHSAGSSIGESRQTYNTPDTTAYNTSDEHHNGVPSDVTWNQDESTFVKKERMRQHVENHNLKKWQSDMEDVTSEWHNLVSDDTLKAFGKVEIARQSVLFEFMRTEKMYYNDLHFLEEVFVPPIRDSNMIPEERRAQFVKDAVFNLSNLVANHKRGLMRIFERQNEEHPLIESVADLILRACIIWQDDYEAYIKHWPIQEATLKAEMRNNKKFADHCEACSRHPKAQRQSIIPLLQRPVFRLPRYPLLLNRMLDNTPEDHSDRENLPVAARAISDIAKSTQPGIEQSNNKVKFWEMASSLDFRLGELHDVDLLDDIRTLQHDGILFKRERSPTDLHGWHAKKVFVMDNYILITEPSQKKKTDAIRYSLTSRPIPLELCHIEEANPSPTHRTNCLLSDERRSDGSRILFTHIEPEREVHGMVLKHVGNGKEYKLYASTASERDTWKFKISEAIAIRRTFIEANKLIVSKTLTNSIFQQSVLSQADKYEKSGSNRINSASMFKWGSRNYVSLATSSGVYIGYEDDKESYRKVIGLKGVEGVTVLSQYSLMILLVEGQLYGYDLEEICPTSSRGPKRKFGRIRLCSSSEKVTYYKVGSTIGKSAIITYVSHKVLHKSTAQFFEPLPVNARLQAYQDVNRVKKPKREVWIREVMPALSLQTTGIATVLFPFPSSKHVAVIDEGVLRVLDPTNSNRMLTLPRLHGHNYQVFKDRHQARQYQLNIANISDQISRGKLKPIELFTVKSGEYIMIFDTLGLYVNEKGVPLKSANVLRWNGTVNNAAIEGNLLLLFCETFIEIRDKRTGKLSQIIRLHKDVRLASQNSLRGEDMVVVERYARSHKPYGLFDHAFKLTCNV